jgi:anthranilate phosphoribosyltransferase
MIRECIPSLLEDRHLTSQEARAAMREIMSGEATPVQVAAFLVALKKKRETVEEVTALAETMREFSRRIHPRIDGCLLDTCGTGGDKMKTFNVSTTCAFVIAGAGIPVAKHGNRSFTSKCGSADVLEHLGLNLNMEPRMVEKSIEELGIGFIYAPNFHPAMKNVASIRREVGVRTVFNILGPLTNPAGANVQLIGVYDENLLEPMCEAAHNLGSRSVMTVYGLDGTDEVSISGRTAVARIKDGRMVRAEIEPEDFGVQRKTYGEVAGYGVEENARITAKVLSGSLGAEDPRLQMVLANAAAGLFLCGKVASLRDGMELAAKSVSDGAAFRKLHDLISFSGGTLDRLERLA